MKALIYILMLFSIISCAGIQGIVSVPYKRLDKDELTPKNPSYAINIPKGYKVITLVGGFRELEKQYVYSDSTKIYISDFESSPLNYSNILSLGDSIANKRFEGVALKAKIAKELRQQYVPGTLILEGKTGSGFWKDIRIGDLSVGYVNIPENRKMEFDKALDSFKKNN